MQTGRRERCTRQHKLIHELCLVVSGDESHLLLRSHLTMEDLESEEFKVHDPCVAWLNGKGRWRVTVAWLRVLVAVEVERMSPGWSWACFPPAMQLSVALLTHNSPSTLCVQRRKWLCAPGTGTSCPSASTATSPALSWTTALWWVTAVRLMKTGNRFQHRLAHNEGQLDKLSSQ